MRDLVLIGYGGCVTAGGESNAPDVEQRTPLMWAADRLDSEMVTMLLSQGADPTQKDCNGQQASDRAGGSEDVLEALITAEMKGRQKSY
jgi:hypothetical protein